MSSLSDDDGDDHFLSKLDVEEMETEEEKGKSKVVEMDQDEEVVFVGDCFKKPEPKPGPAGKRPESEAETWKDFLAWFESQQTFDTPWFQSIPLTRLSFSQCKSVLVSCQDWSLLGQLANMVLGFFKETREIGDENGSENMISLLEILLRRVESELMDTGDVVEPSQGNALPSVFEELLQVYLSGREHYLMESSSIPSLLVKLHPPTLETILIETLKTKNVRLLIPICSNSPANFQKILKFFNSEELYAKAGLNINDPDFQNYTNPKQELVSNLLNSLKQKLGTGYYRLLPSKLQPIFCFDSVVSSGKERLKNNDMVVKELLNILNVLFSDCDNELEFLRFMLRLLPHTWSVLSNKKLMKSVTYKNHPYVYVNRYSF